MNFFIGWNSYKFEECCLQSDNLDKTNFVSKNWPSDPKVACNSPSSLIELIEANVILGRIRAI